MALSRRSFMAAGAAGVTALAAPHIANAQTLRTVKMGSLRLIHSMTPHFYQQFMPANLHLEIITFDSPTDGKNAVVTRSVDFGGFGIAAATLGAAAGEPVVVCGAFCNRGMGVISRWRSDPVDPRSAWAAGRYLAGLDAGSVHHGAPAHGGHVDPRHHRRARALR